MKRKFFSLMVAACAALFSFTGLTGCGGGGDEDGSVAGYLTYNDFAERMYGIRIYGAPVYINIKPENKDIDVSVQDTPFSPKTMIGFISDRSGRDKIANIVMRYNIQEWIVPQDDGTTLSLTTDQLKALYKNPEGALPRTATMTVSLAKAADSANSTLLASLGLYSNGVKIKSIIEYKLLFSETGNVVQVAVLGDDGDNNSYIDGVRIENSSTLIGAFDVLKSVN